MRWPASFSSGCAPTWIAGSEGICISAATSRRGDRNSDGARGASTTACSAAEGSSYAVTPCACVAAGCGVAEKASGATASRPIARTRPVQRRARRVCMLIVPPV
ncbi:hypothetical protein G6F64_014075 [Rhizopus arrhizus]|uniref:Uncharacterized protein n=1 Tax=Rhizopus oryzae TaxID=64495 RepID=A0A9P7BJP4_RHIOR|nr:hypothetical protein G6F64_014075 [Rhizopus arrhizus]